MKSALVILIMICVHAGCAQPSKAPQLPHSDLNPGTIRIKTKVKSVDNEIVILLVQEVISTGQGVTNIVSEGDELRVSYTNPNLKIKAGQTVICDLTERVGVDSSQSTYAMANVLPLQH